MQREGLAEGQLRRREATAGRKPKVKRWPDEQESHEAHALGEEATNSEAPNLYGKCVRRCGRDILFDDLDKELEKRGLRFCRYADDCNIYAGSRFSGNRVLEALLGFLEEVMKLKVNRAKSAVDRPVNRVFLGYSFTIQGQTKIRVPEKTCRGIEMLS